MDFWRAVDILSKRKWLILLSMVVTCALTFGATRLIGSRWVATVRFVSAPNSPLTSSGEAAPTDAAGSLGAARSQAAVYLAIVRSRAVLEPALRQLNLLEVPANLLENIEFEAVGPYLFELRVYDSSPSRAGRLANAIARVFEEKNRGLYTQQAQRVVTLLEDQLQKADRRLAEVRRRYDAYRRSHQIVTGNLSDQLSPALYRLQTARQQRDQVLERIAEVRARLDSKRRELAQLPPTVPDERPVSSTPRVRLLEEELARVEARLTSLRARYTDEKIEVRQALAEKNALEEALKQELSRQPRPLAERPNPEVALAKQAIRELEQELAGYQAQLQALDMTLASAQTEIRKFTGIDSPMGAMASELVQQTEVRNHLAARLQNAQMALDVAERQNPLTVMDPVNDFNPPTNTQQGRARKLLALAALCALVGTSGLVIALDSVDRRLRTVQEAEMALPVPVCAAIPQPLGNVSAESLSRVTELQPLSLHSEAYRFLGLRLLNQPNGTERIRSLMALSAKADQGSTSTVTNLGITLAQAGQRVVIVDANVRAPQLHEVFGLPNTFGLTDLLQSPDPAAFEQALRPTPVPNLWVVTAGSGVDNPWQLFRSPHLAVVAERLEGAADYVLYDTPSALAFTDALNLAPVVDGAFLCVRALEPPSGAEQRLLEALEQCGTTVLGSVFSGVPASVLESYQNYVRYYPIERMPVPAVVAGAEELNGSHGDPRPALAASDGAAVAASREDGRSGQRGSKDGPTV
ncbi:MAG TPA: hypothetical protein VNL14_05300 [Candidatus Acidoferrales bacterium]|nr:hypothetical protein [Candidatus Acidoferrales bacterium]